jgi:tRNA1(Val) A37 N6-methylase TrmN6
MRSLNREASTAQIFSTELNGSDFQFSKQEIDKELSEIKRGDLRTSGEIKELYHLLRNASAEQRNLAEDLGLGLLTIGRPLKECPEFVIQVAPDMSEIRYGLLNKIDCPTNLSDLNPSDKNSALFDLLPKVDWLISVYKPTLVTPYLSVLWENCNNDIEKATKIETLEKQGQRLTYYGDMPLTWDKSVDRRAWSFNTDTAHLCHWLTTDNAFGKEVKKTAEIGCGMGGLSAHLLNSCSNIEKHVITDICPEAINGTVRNIKPYTNDVVVDWQLGKGIKRLTECGIFDLIVSNPPYLLKKGESASEHIFDPTDDSHRYGGTRLIREFFEYAPLLLNPDNKNAAIYFQCSNLSLRDIEIYKKEFPNIKIELVGGPKEVPLKIWNLEGDNEWIDYLKEFGLKDSDELAKETGNRYFHQILAFKLQIK